MDWILAKQSFYLPTPEFLMEAGDSETKTRVKRNGSKRCRTSR